MGTDYTNDPFIPAWYVPGWTAQTPIYILDDDQPLHAQFPDLVIRTVVGEFFTLDGMPVSGNIRVTPNVDVTYTDPTTGAHTRLVKRTEKVYIENGKATIELVATDNDNLTPRTFTYHVVEKFLGGTEYDIVVQKTGTGDLDLYKCKPSSVSVSKQFLWDTESNA